MFKTSNYTYISRIALLWFFCSISVFADVKKNTPEAVSVNVTKVKKINFPVVIKAVGHVYAIKQVDLSFDNSGRLQHKYFNNGDRVLAGESVAALNDEQDLANLKSLQAKLDLAKKTYNRVKPLKDSGAISDEVIDQKMADLQQAQANVDEQSAVVDRDKIKAPFTGVLSIYKFDVGSYIPSGTSIVKLTQETPLKVRFSIAADYKSQIHIGNKVEVSSTVYPSKVFTGKVNYIAPTIDSKSGTIAIEAEVANDDYLLSPGMFMSVSQIVKSKNLVLVVPDTAIQTSESGRYVYKYESGGVVKKIMVKVGLMRDGWTQITSGVNEGEKIISIGGNKLTDGAKVILSDIPPPPDHASNTVVSFNLNHKSNAK